RAPPSRRNGRTPTGAWFTQLAARASAGAAVVSLMALTLQVFSMSGNDLTYPGGKLRLYVEAPLGQGVRVVPDEGQAHYLLHVMRAKENDRVSLFNGRDGEWLARVAEVSKRSCSLECDRLGGAQTGTPGPWLGFPPVNESPAGY